MTALSNRNGFYEQEYNKLYNLFNKLVNDLHKMANKNLLLHQEIKKSEQKV